MTDPDCTCETYQTHDRICFKCENTFNIARDSFFRRMRCHKHTFVTMCGYPPHICTECASEGWRPVGGHGGKDYAVNEKTKETKWERQIDIDAAKKRAEDPPEPLF